jgi:hypothetical protein
MNFQKNPGLCDDNASARQEFHAPRNTYHPTRATAVIALGRPRR